MSATAPENVVPLVTLVMDSIQKLGMEVEHIPGGCTSLCQPFDARIDRLLNANIHKNGADWVLGSGISISMTKPLTRKLIVGWVMKAYNNFSVEIVIKFWKHGTYSWFDCN